MLALSRLSPKDQLQVLLSAGQSIDLAPDDGTAAFERVRLRSLGVAAEITDAEGGGVTAETIAPLLGLTRESVRRLRRRGQLIAWRKGGQRFRYPVWQAYRGAILPGLSAVLSVLVARPTSPLAMADYFLSESDELGGRRPLDLLRDKRVLEVLQHVQRYGVQGA
ncbi:MAG TPA: hypothetical protein VG734_17455 [Lacunisphaera sp.]|nr:hypothetical protein [Lacunisphaera sp.]